MAKIQSRAELDNVKKSISRQMRDSITRIEKKIDGFKKEKMEDKPITPTVMNEALTLLEGVVRNEGNQLGIIGMPVPKILKIPVKDEDVEACGGCFVGYSASDGIVFCIDGLLDRIRTHMEKAALKQ